MGRNYSKNFLVHEYLSNQYCSKETLEYLYNELKDDKYVCQVVGRKSICPIEILREISNKYPDYVVENYNCPVDILEKEVNNYSSWFGITRNKNCPSSILKKIYNLYYGMDKLDRNYSYDILENILSNPNCPVEILLKESNEQSFFIELNIARNPNCPVEILEKYLETGEYTPLENEKLSFSKIKPFLYSKKTGELNMGFGDIDVLKNPQLPYEIYKELFDKYKNEYNLVISSALANPKYSKTIIDEVSKYDLNSNNRCALASHPDCTPEMLEKISNTDNEDVILAIIYNKKCPSELLEKLVDFENPKILGNILVHPNCSIYLFDYIIEKCISVYNDLSYLLNAKILDDKCPKRFIQYVACNKHLIKYLNENAYDKVQKVPKNDDMRILFFDGYFKGNNYPSNHIDLNYLSRGINFVKEETTDNKTDFSKSISNQFSAKITIDCDNKKYIEEKQKEFGKDEFAYGEFPQRRVSSVEDWILNMLYRGGHLNKTGKQYRIINGIGFVNYYKEYEINGCKYVKAGSKWYSVEPIYWKYSFEEKRFICEKDLFGLNPIINDKTKMLYKFFANDIIVPETIFSKEERQDIITSKKEQLVNEKIDEKSVDRQLKVLTTQRKNIEEEKENLELEILLLLEKLNEAVRKLNELQSNNIKTKIPRIHLDESVYLQKIDDHYEFKPKYIPYLQHIDLSGLSLIPNLKASGIDYRETNASLNPQMVYKKDLSYTKLSDENISFKSLAGVNLTGADISADLNCYDYDKAIIDDDTLLPSRKK